MAGSFSDEDREWLCHYSAPDTVLDKTIATVTPLRRVLNSARPQ